MFSLTDLREQLAEQGAHIPVGSIPRGITRNNAGEAVMYYAGPELLPSYLMEVDSLISVPFRDPFEERVEGVEYFASFDWDTTEAGFVDITRPDKEVVRHYLTQHQPTSISTLPEGDAGKVWWFRKVFATLPNSVQVKVWEKFEKTERNLKTGL